MKPLTLSALIKSAKAGRDVPTEEVYIKRLDSTIKIQALDSEEIQKVLDEHKDDADAIIVQRGVVEPNLMDKKVLEALGCLSYTQAIDKMFLPHERNAISVQIFKLSTPKDAVVLVRDLKKQ